MELRKTLKVLKDYGYLTVPVRRTGELRVIPPNGGPTIRLNGRRKDAPRVLIALLHKLAGGRRAA